MGTTLPPDQYRDWAQGLITSLRADEIPANASPRALNSALVSVGGGRCTVGQRRGAALVNTDLIVDGALDAAEVNGLAPFYNTETDTLYRLVTTADGQLRRLLDDDTHTSISASFLTADMPPPVWAFLHNRAFVANGTDRKKVIVVAGTLTPQNVGIVRPVVGSFAGTAGAATGPTGTYELVVTYGNSNTGHESSRSDFVSVTLTDDKLNLSNIPVSPDSQVDRRYIYARNTATQTAYYRIHTLNDNSTTSATGITWVDALVIIESPDGAQNDPPPASASLRGFITHAGRLFAWDDENLYYSALGKPEAFDPEAVEPVSPQDGQRIIGCIVNDRNTLVIFKERSIYGLFGDDPNSWTVELIDPSVGLVGPHAINIIEGVTYFYSHLGPMAWQFGGRPEQIGLARIAPDVDPDVLNAAVLSRAMVVADPPRQRVLFCLPSVDSDAINFILAYHYRLQTFEGRWEPFDMASVARMKDAAGREFVYFGGYFGRIFKWWASTTDGARLTDGVGNVFTLQTTVAAGTSSTVFTVDAAAELDEDHLPGLYLYLFDADERTYQRRRIASVDNTAKEIEVSAAFDGTPETGRTVVLASPIFEWDTKWNDSGDPFLMKRYMDVFAIAACAAGNTSAYLDVFLNHDDVTAARTWSFDVTGGGAVFDEAMFDISLFASGSTTRFKRRVAKTGGTYRIRVRHIEPDRPFVIVALGLVAHTQNYKS